MADDFRCRQGLAQAFLKLLETDIMNFRERMTSIIAVLALASGTSLAQAPVGGPQRGPGGVAVDAGIAASAGRPTTLQRQGLDDPALKLSGVQKTQIDTLFDGYMAEQNALGEKYPMTPGAPPSAEVTVARAKLREQFTAAVIKVLDDSQRKTWEAVQAAARPVRVPAVGVPSFPGGPGGSGPPPAR